MTKLKLLSAALIAAATLATPAMARTSHVTSRQHLAEDANASAFPPAQNFDGRVCVPAPRVGAFATAPWSEDNVPCEPESDWVDEQRAPGLAFRAVLGRSIRSIGCSPRCNSLNVEKVGLEGSPARSEPDGFGIIVARTVGELHARAGAIGLAREQAAAEKLAAEHKRRVKEAEKARQARLLAIARRGEGVWREVEAEIERRNAAAYDRAAGLLLDLQAVAKERGTIEDFLRRLHAIRERHVRKERFIERLAALE